MLSPSRCVRCFISLLYICLHPLVLDRNSSLFHLSSCLLPSDKPSSFLELRILYQNQLLIPHSDTLTTPLTVIPMETGSTSSNCVYQWKEGVPDLPSLFSPFQQPSLIVYSRYYADTDNISWPPQVQDFNKQFTKMLETIKTRHDPTVTTVAQGVLEWKRLRNAQHIGLDIQSWLDRFYMSRIGIRFLIGQRESDLCASPSSNSPSHHSPFTSSSDVALNTQQAHEDYVGIICTKAVRPSLFFLKKKKRKSQYN